MALIDEHGRRIIEDWHPNGHLQMAQRGSDQHEFCLQYQWERLVIERTDDPALKWITEKEWRRIPGEGEEG